MNAAAPTKTRGPVTSVPRLSVPIAEKRGGVNSTLGAPVKKTVPELFDALNLQQAQSIVNLRKEKQATINLAFFNGDHWQAGLGWVGPTAGAADDAVGSATLRAIEKSFVSRNAIAEVTNRHVAGVLGRTVHWKLSIKRELGDIEVVDPETQIKTIEKEQPTEDEQNLIDEAEAALVAWWDKREVGEILQNMTAAALNTKRGVLRIYVPPDLRDDTGNIPVVDLADALDYIWLQHLGTNDDTLAIEVPSATVYTQKTSRRQIGVYTYRQVEEVIGNIGAPLAGDTPDRAELTYLDEQNNTVLRIINGAGNAEDPVTMPLGGRLLMYELTRAWLVTPQVVSQQKLLNMTMTMKQRNAVLGGFLERVFTNVDWPGDEVADPTSPTGKKWVRKPLKVGPGVMTNLEGLVTTDEDGNKSRATPGVNYRDPVTPATFIATEESSYLAILQETNQLHYALAGDAVVSGESRKQAREAYKQDLHVSAGKVQGAVRWALETALAMAAIFANRAGAFDGLRVYAQARIDSGPVSADDMRVAVEMRDAELWAQETAMSATGIEDVDAEMQRLAKQKAERDIADAERLAAAQKLIDEANSTQPGLSRREQDGQDGQPEPKQTPEVVA